MRARHALVLPHEPNAVFQGQLVQINLSWLALEDNSIGRRGLRVLEHLLNDLFLGLDGYSKAVAEACADSRRLLLIDLLEHDELRLSRLQNLAYLLDTIWHALDAVVDFGELEEDLDGAFGRTLAVRNVHTVVVRQVERFDLAQSVGDGPLLPFSDRQLE